MPLPILSLNFSLRYHGLSLAWGSEVLLNSTFSLVYLWFVSVAFLKYHGLHDPVSTISPHSIRSFARQQSLGDAKIIYEAP